MAETTETNIKAFIAILMAPGATKAFNTLGQLANQNIATRAMIAATTAAAKRTPFEEEIADLLTDERRGKAYLRGFYPVYKYLQTNPQPAAEQLNELIAAAWEEITEQAKGAENALKAFRQTREFKELRAAFADIDEMTDPQSQTSNLDIFYILPFTTDPARFMPGIREYIAEQQAAGAPLSFEAFTEGTGTEGDAPPAFITILRKLTEKNTGEHLIAGMTRKGLPLFTHTEPRHNLYLNTALQNTLIEAAEDGEAFDLTIAHRGKNKEPVTAYTLIRLEDETGAPIEGVRLTEWDKCIYNALCTEYKAGNMAFREDDLIRTMNGQTSGERVREELREKTKAALRMFENLAIKTDYSAYWRNRPARGSVEYERRALRVDRLIFTLQNGQKREAYQFIEKPVLLALAETTGQIITVPAQIVSIKETDRQGHITTVAVRMEAERQIIRDYLIQRIEVMKNDKQKTEELQAKAKKPQAIEPRQRHIILFETIYEKAGALSRTQKQRAREFVEICLNYWKATGLEAGGIIDYSIEKKGNRARAIQIKI